MALYSQASFKNSRVSTRAATTSTNVWRQPVALGPANTLVASPNANRTYITLRNENVGANDDIRYDYFDNANILTEGFLLKAGEAIDLETTQFIYAQAVTNPVTMSIDEGSG
jgi:hypothetical protein